MTDVLVLGSGGAGLSVAVRARAAGLSVAVLTKGELGWSATRYAQGGVAAALVEDDDSPELHGSDTLAAGGGLNDPDAVRVLAAEGPARVRELIELGAHFDNVDGALALAREGGHSVPRVVHAGGDATGAEIERALTVAVRASGAEVHEGWLVTDVIVEHNRVCGVTVFDASRTLRKLRADHVVVATGGAGQCFAVTTNPPLSTGDGVAMALRAGAAVADVEFMQFHPTALHHPSMPRPLLSEALRGEGAILRDDHGVAFMASEHPLADLAPRDVVARAISSRLNERGLDHLWLDATGIDGFRARFPTIWGACEAVGLDPTRDWLPVAPAAHYLCGGVCTDLDGATTLPGLWACGEVACTGVHGANRLASNSLLENLVFAARVVVAILGGKRAPEPTGVLRGMDLDPGASPPTSSIGAVPGDAPIRDDLQRLMTREAGVVRTAAGLARARDVLAAMSPSTIEEANLLAVSTALVRAAAVRCESRGTHTRADYPEESSEYLGRFVFAGASGPTFLPLFAAAGSTA
ncbi:MAG TPA: L-aspartate oxidase [Acidimicrobiia bacterium]|nr:L-aspartate oxidase [Acidimicrobiia bacterium]